MKKNTIVKDKEEGYFDYLQKIIIIGDSGVGKSNILLRYSRGSFAENHMTTVGLNYVFKVETVDDVRVKLQIWDTAGQDKFKTITKSYYRNSQGVLVVFGVDSRDSYYSVQNWMEDLAETTSDKTRILLVGNKKDLQGKREVSFEEASALAKNYGVDYMECSAKTGDNVRQIFLELGKKMKIEFIDRHEPEERNSKLEIQGYRFRQKCCQK